MISFLDYQPSIEEAFLELFPRVIIVPSNQITSWFSDGMDLEAECTYPLNSTSIDDVELLDPATGSWKYTHACGIALSSSDGSPIVLIADLVRGLVDIHYVSFSRMAPLQLVDPLASADDDVLGLRARDSAQETVTAIQFGLRCWVDGKVPDWINRNLNFLNWTSVQPLCEALGVLLHYFGLFTDVLFTQPIEEIVQGLSDNLPQLSCVSVTRETPLELSLACTVSQLAFSTTFDIPENISSAVTLFLQQRDTWTLSWMDFLHLTLYFVKEPLTFCEIIKLGAELGLKPNTPAGTKMNHSRDVGEYTRITGLLNGAASGLNQIKQRGPVTEKRQRKHSSVSVCPARVSQRRTSEGVLPRLTQTTVQRMHPGSGKGTHWYLWSLTELGRMEAAEKIGLRPTRYNPSEATLSNPISLLKRLLVENGGELSRTELFRLWAAEVPCNPHQQATQNCLRLSLVHWCRSSWGSPSLLETQDRDGEIFYRLRMDTAMAPVDIIHAEIPLEPFTQEVLDLFKRDKLVQIREVFVLLHIQADQKTLAQLESAVNTLVKRHELHCMDQERVSFNSRYYLCGPVNPSFETFYAALNGHLRNSYMIENKLDFSRSLARIAFDSRMVNSTTGLFSKFTINALDCPAVSIKYCEEYPELGRGLFANIDLPAGTSFPVTGRVKVGESAKSGAFLPYGFSHQNEYGQRVEIDTKPDDIVTCLAGYVNDPLNTHHTANAEQQLCQREQRLYLVLTETVPAGQQIFWKYGPEYWTAHIQLYIQPMPELMDYVPQTSLGSSNLNFFDECNRFSMENSHFDPNLFVTF